MPSTERVVRSSIVLAMRVAVYRILYNQSSFRIRITMISNCISFLFWGRIEYRGGCKILLCRTSWVWVPSRTACTTSSLLSNHVEYSLLIIRTWFLLSYIVEDVSCPQPALEQRRRVLPCPTAEHIRLKMMMIGIPILFIFSFFK